MHTSGKGAMKEVLILWATSFASIYLALVVEPFSGASKAAAAVSFLYLPGIVIWRRNEDFSDYGATLKNWKKGALLGLAGSVTVLSLFALGFSWVVRTISNLPQDVTASLIPYHSSSFALSLRFPPNFWKYILDQFLVVALPEELFYRGFIQTRLREVWPQGRVLWGARLGKAFWVTQILFALGHLTEPYFWRLAVFFPSLIFGWMREKSGTILPSTIFHALSNLTILVLEMSYFHHL